jgi:pyrroloquinoline quinone (PQQ) biosynthesis protein C
MNAARGFVGQMERELEPFVTQVATGPFVESVFAGEFPLDGIRFVHTNHYHLLMNDMANLNLYVAKARSEEEMLFFHFMAAEEKNHIEALYYLTDALEIDRQRLTTSEPHAACLVRTNYFSRLAQYGTAGEIAVAILLNFPVWAAGAKREASGLREHYGLGNAVPGTDARDTDILDRFATATEGFTESALKIIERDLATPGSEERLAQAARWSVEYEAMVWDSYYDEGARVAGGAS